MFDITQQPHPDDPNRNAAGQFTKGNAASPGRRRRSEEQAMLAVLNEVLPPEKVKAHLEKCIEWAYHYQSPKLLMQVLAFHYSYTIGQPVQRSISASGKLENILDRLSSMSEEEFTEVEQAMRGG